MSAAAVQVDALLNGVDGAAPPVAWIASQLEALGYGSWAHRIVNTAGALHHPVLTTGLPLTLCSNTAWTGRAAVVVHGHALSVSCL